MVKFNFINESQVLDSLGKGKGVKSSVEEVMLSYFSKKVSLIESFDELKSLPLLENKINLYDHQINTVLKVLNNLSHRVILADEVGLGKTIEAGIVIKEFLVRNIVKKILILTPATLKYQWKQEMESKFLESFDIADDPSIYESSNLVISSIDTAKQGSHYDEILKVHWDLIIVDEAHKLKNSATLNYKLVKNLNKERFLMLTATPLQNNLYELWALCDLLHPGLLGTKSKFTDNFLNDKDGLLLKNNSVLRSKLDKIMIRNLRRDVGIEFVDRIVKTHLLNYSKVEQKFYSDVIAFIKKQYIEVKDKSEATTNSDVEDIGNLSKEELKNIAQKYRQKGLLTFSLIMLTRQLTSSIKTGLEALKRYRETLDDDVKVRELDSIIYNGEQITEDKKLDYLIKLLKKEIKGNDKAIVFTTFVETQKRLALELKFAGYSVVLFNGKMTPIEKEKAIEDFKDNKQILVCTDAGSEGRNLQFAHILINYDLPWNPMRIEQRIGRVHRLGQTRDVKIHNISVNDTIESYILNRLYEKIDLFNVAIGEMDLILSELKSKGSFESKVFSSFMAEDLVDSEKELTEDLVGAKSNVEKINKFDGEIFSDLIKPINNKDDDTLSNNKSLKNKSIFDM